MKTQTATAQRGDFLNLLEPLPPMKQRSQTFNPKNRKWVKRDRLTGRFRWIKKDGDPFKRVATDFELHGDLPPAA
jgi:hypothetical protein